MSVIWVTVGGNRGLLDSRVGLLPVYSGFVSHIIHIKKKKKKLLIKMGCFSWNQRISEVWGYPGKRVRGRKSGYLQHHQKCYLEKEMAIHSSILAWRIPQTEEYGRLQSMGSQELDMTLQLNHQTTTTKVQYWFWGLFPNVLYAEAEFTIKYDCSILCRRPGFDPWVRKIPWRREWQFIPNSCLENSMDRAAWWAIVRGITESQTQLSN